MSDLTNLMTILQRNNFVILDTETTGLDDRAEIVQLGVIDKDGAILIDQLIQPTRPCPPDATAIHGITNEMVAGKPTIAEVFGDLFEAIVDKDLIIYNANYDLRIILQALGARDISFSLSELRPSGVLTACAMEAYAEHYGDWNEYRQSYRWQKLSVACAQQGIIIKDAHSAVGDCQMTLALIRSLEAKNQLI